MSNMSYCRFENTVNDLEDCAEHMNDENLSETEEKAREQLIDLCRDILDECEQDLDDEV